MAGMLEKLKQWGQRLLHKSFLEGNHQGGIADLESTYNHLRTDPRELPRPPRSIGTKSLQRKLDSKTLSPEENEIGQCTVSQRRDSCDISACKCINCSELKNTFSDCVVCLEPLQGAKIFSCRYCGNIACWSCMERVHHCPFCRAEDSSNFRIHNIAVERLLTQLALPCRNARWGCDEEMKLDHRADHELICQHTPMGCPWHQLCGWHGDSKDINHHLKHEHMMTVLPGNRITIDITHFRAKMAYSDHKPRKYAISLSCHASIFICKVVMYKRKMRMTFLRVSEAQINIRYGAWLEIRSSFRTLKGIMPISVHCTHSKALDVSCENLVSPWKKTDDQVKIDITIRPII